MNLSDESRKKLKLARSYSNGNSSLSYAKNNFTTATNTFKNLSYYFSRISLNPTNISDVSSAERGANFLKNVSMSMITGGIDAAFLLYSKSVTIGFSSVKNPALSGLASMTGGLYDEILAPLAEQERIEQQIRMMEISSYRVASLYLSQRLLSSLAASAKVAMSSGALAASRTISRKLLERSIIFGSIRVVADLLRKFGFRISGRLLARLGVKFVPGIGFISLGADATFLALFLRNYFKEKREDEINKKFAQSKRLLNLFNPQKNLEVYRNSLPLLLESGYEDFSLLAGYGRENTSFVNDVYASSSMNLLSMGVSTEDILNLGSDLSRTTTVSFDQLDQLTSTVFDYSTVFSGGSTNQVSSIMSYLIRAIPNSENDISLAEKAFEDFFASVVGNGKPQGAHLNLVRALAQFSSDYGRFNRLSDTAPEEIAKINQFMTENGLISGRFDVTATQTVTRLADKTLLEGFVTGNVASRAILRNAGLTPYQAIQGVTSDARLFERFLASTLYTMGIKRSEFPSEENDVYSEEISNKFRSLVYELNLNSEEANALFVALRRYASGKNIEEVREEYVTSSQPTASTLEEIPGFLSDYADFSNDIIENVTISRNLLIDTVDRNINMIRNMQLIVESLMVDNVKVYGEVAASHVRGLLEGMFFVPTSFSDVFDELDVDVTSGVSQRAQNYYSNFIERTFLANQDGMRYRVFITSISGFDVAFSQRVVSLVRENGLERYLTSDGMITRDFVSQLNLLLEEDQDSVVEPTTVPTSPSDEPVSLPPRRLPIPYPSIEILPSIVEESEAELLQEEEEESFNMQDRMRDIALLYDYENYDILTGFGEVKIPTGIYTENENGVTSYVPQAPLVKSSIDILTPREGSPIPNILEGVVTEIQHTGFIGSLIIVKSEFDEEYDLFIVYIGVGRDSISVSIGDSVSRGQVLGNVAGYKIGPRYFEVAATKVPKGTSGQREYIDPAPFIEDLNREIEITIPISSINPYILAQRLVSSFSG